MTMPSYVPAAYDNWVTEASAGSGLPVAVVAAQINDESGFNPNAESSAGAEGIAQFLPSTYAGVGGTGSEYNAQNELQPYITLTKQNLAWSGGNIEKALAAYNAGQGDWQAGLGYADTILSNAGEPASADAVPGDVTTTGGTSSTPSNGNVSLGSVGPFSASISSDKLERFGLIVFGAGLIAIGLWMMFGKQTIKLASMAKVA
jgi:hypothetical protein